MNQTACWVIKVLEDSNRRSIEYENKRWLYYNADEMHILVRIEDCNVKLHEINYAFDAKKVMLVQNGEKFKSKSEFNPKKEALFIVDVGFGHNRVYQYFPKE